MWRIALVLLAACGRFGFDAPANVLTRDAPTGDTSGPGMSVPAQQTYVKGHEHRGR